MFIKPLGLAFKMRCKPSQVSEHHYPWGMWLPDRGAVSMHLFTTKLFTTFTPLVVRMETAGFPSVSQGPRSSLWRSPTVPSCVLRGWTVRTNFPFPSGGFSWCRPK